MLKPYVNKTNKEGLFQGQNIVFTGFRNKDWQNFIEAEEGK